jgi:hypothetical protein
MLGILAFRNFATEPARVGAGPEMAGWASSGRDSVAGDSEKRSRNTRGCPTGYRRRFRSPIPALRGSSTPP